MRIAALYDIHANLPALEAVLEEVRRVGADEIVVGGDVLPGPMPVETIDRLMDLEIPVHFIRGNGDREALAWRRGTETSAIPEPFRDAMRWNVGQLDARHENALASWPATFRLRIGGLGEVLFCHATPRNDTEIFTRLTAESRLLPVFEGIAASVVVCGHTHMQFDRMIGEIRVVNAGSVGMPFGAAGADWALLGPDIELRHTDYDVDAAAARIRRTKYPQAEEFAVRNMLQPPSEKETLQAFERAELR